MVKLERCVGSCNAINDLSNKVCAPSKTEDLNQRVFEMIWGINELKTLKHMSCKCKCRFDKRRKFNSDQWWNNNKCWYDCKKLLYVKNIFFYSYKDTFTTDILIKWKRVKLR